MNRPLLLIDVDGVISLFGFDPKRPPGGKFQIVDGIAHYLSSAAAAHLLELSRWYEPVWCTGWEEKANEYLPHALGLPGPWPYLEFSESSATYRRHDSPAADDRPESPAADDEPGQPDADNRHWKLAAIDRFAGPSRRLAWIDDSHDERTGAWAAARPGPTLLICTEPSLGLTGTHVDELLRWAAAVAPPSRG